MKPKTISVHLIETNPNVPLRPALDYNALGSTQPNLHNVSTHGYTHGKPKLFFACGQIRTVIINRNISQYRKSHNAVNRYSNDKKKKKSAQFHFFKLPNLLLRLIHV